MIKKLIYNINKSNVYVFQNNIINLKKKNYICQGLWRIDLIMNEKQNKTKKFRNQNPRKGKKFFV